MKGTALSEINVSNLTFGYDGQAEDVVLRYQPTLLFVEHDHRFEEKIATKAVQLRKADV